MKNLRVIGRLDIKGPNLVKGIHLEGLRILGKPDLFARRYYQEGIDELIYVDVVASLYGRNSLDDIIERTSREIFIPLTVAGGIRTLEDIQRVLRAGADKVAINTGAVKRPDFIREASRRFGSSTIVACIEAKRVADTHYEAYTDCGREKTGLEVVSWARRLEQEGAGEIYLVSVDRDGTGKGYEIDLIREVAQAVRIPVIAGGGAGCASDVVKAAKDGMADAVSIASIFHYRLLAEQEKLAEKKNDHPELLSMRRGFGRITPSSVAEVKQMLIGNGVHCRAVSSAAALKE